MNASRPTPRRRQRRSTAPLAGVILACALIAAGAGRAEDPVPSRLPGSFSPRLAEAIRGGWDSSRILAAGRSDRVPCFVSGNVSAQSLRSLGADVGRSRGGVTTARIPRARLLEAGSLPGVTRITPATRMTPTLDLSGIDTKATLVHQGTPDAGVGVMGDNALIAIIDTGIDWSHPDFKKPGGQTRIVGMWDQNDPIGPPPAGFSYGSVWTPPQIDAATCRERDSTFYGHGTHVAGIAGGSGRGTGNSYPNFTYVGIAPHADFLIVNTTFDDVDIADALDWIDLQATALGRPVVVNMSFGTDYGPHDGTLELDQFINAWTGPGRVVVAGAGNSNGKGRHGEMITPISGDGVMSFRIFGYTPSPSYPDGVSVDLWYQGGDNLVISVRTPSGILVGPVGKGLTLSQSTADAYITIDHTGVEGGNLNGDVEALIDVSDAGGIAPVIGDYEIHISRVSAPSGGEVDAWIYDWSMSFPPAFVLGKEEAELIISPASTDSAISVGAHTTRTSWTSLDTHVYNYGQVLNQICNFSSPGPRRDNVLKPDLSAPGSAIGSTHSATSLPVFPALVLPDGVHKILQGTSMSSPQVAGAAALLLSRWPNLSGTQVRTALMNSARSDGFTGAVPNNTWGRGKLDLEALFNQRLAFTTTVDPPRFAPPGTSLSLIDLCALPSAGTWTTKYHVMVKDSAGWLNYANGGPPSPIPMYDAITTTVGPGYRRCAPVYGALTIEIPPGAMNGQSTTVTFDAEPDGLPWMRITKTMTATVSSTSGAPAGSSTPLALDLSVGAPSSSGGRRLALALPTSGEVTLDLFDVAGRQRARVAERWFDAGWTSVDWSGRDGAGRRLASGVYLLRLTSGASVVTRRIVLAE